MNKVERIKAALAGETCDQLPYSFWSHLPQYDLDPVLLAEKTYEFFKTYDIDFVKTMNNGMYPVEDYNCTIDFSGIEKGGVAEIVSTPIQTIDDWKKLTPTDITGKALQRELKSLKLLLDKVQGEAPVVFTLFSPITIANKLSNNQLLDHIKTGETETIHEALAHIADTTAELAREAIRLGAAGVFFATQLSSYNVTDEATYEEFGVPYDLKVLEAASEGWFNILHAHGDNIMYRLLKEYPTQVFNWHVWETLPELEEARDTTDKTLMGGLNRMDITHSDFNSLHNQIYQCLKILNGKGHILTPGCVIRYPLNDEVLKYIKDTKMAIEASLR